jgi:hypothetical protein
MNSTNSEKSLLPKSKIGFDSTWFLLWAKFNGAFKPKDAFCAKLIELKRQNNTTMYFMELILRNENKN